MGLVSLYVLVPSGGKASPTWFPQLEPHEPYTAPPPPRPAFSPGALLNEAKDFFLNVGKSGKDSGF